MNRRHSVENYYEILHDLKLKRPDIAISSDFIVGFPGETNEDFDKTMEFINNVNFVIAYSRKIKIVICVTTKSSRT